MSHHRKKTQAIRAFPWHFLVLFGAFIKSHRSACVSYKQHPSLLLTLNCILYGPQTAETKNNPKISDLYLFKIR
jgi:hypothetical protein